MQLGEGMPTLIFMSHQTIADLLCTILIDGSCEKWQYGEVKHRLGNAALTEVFVEANGCVDFGTKNDGGHLISSPNRRNRRGSC